AALPYAAPVRARARGGGRGLSLAAFILLVVGLSLAAVRLFQLLHALPLARWGVVLLAVLLTLGRVLLSTALGTLWALPAGLAIGLSPRLSRIFQPVIQVAASFPAPMLFPIAIALFQVARLPLGWGSVLLML